MYNGAMEFDNTRQQGAYGLGQAISYFLSEGYNISLPIAESQRYDLVIEKEGKLDRVEVKSSSSQTGEVSFTVSLTTCGGNRSGAGVRKKISGQDCDVVFIYTMDNKAYVFPVEVVEDMSTITVGKKWTEYQVSGEVYTKPERVKEFKPRPQKIDGPGKQALLDSVELRGYTGTARMLSTDEVTVSDNAVRKQINK